jgi:hypothetical protein
MMPEIQVWYWSIVNKCDAPTAKSINLGNSLHYSRPASDSMFLAITAFPALRNLNMLDNHSLVSSGSDLLQVTRSS